MNLINKQKFSARFGEDFHWFTENIPFFECPEPEIEKIYYFRWQVFHKHIKPTPDGFVVTEFLPEVHWVGKHNTISASAPLHLYEGRWLRNRQPLDEYSRFWFRGGGEPRRYSAALADAIWARALVTGDFSLPCDLLPDIVANYRAWENERLDACGLFWQVDDREGEEFTIGGSGFRVPINSYMFADAQAIASIARCKGDLALAQEYSVKAARLKEAVQKLLWDADAHFFKTRANEVATLAHNETYYWAPDNHVEYKGDVLAGVREIFGFVPWTYNLPDAGFEIAWRELFDESGFAGNFGPTTAERRHSQFMQAHNHDCLWNGPSWPFVTTQILTALANLLQNYQQDEVTRDDYLKLLRTYAHSQFLRDGSTRVPWIDESLHPDTGAWLTREALKKRDAPDWDRGRDYNHSGFCDLIISGLLGLRPRADGEIEVKPLVPKNVWEYWCLEDVPYHDKLLTIFYDQHGSHYGQGSGLQVRERLL